LSFEFEFEKGVMLMVMKAHHAANNRYFKIVGRNTRRSRRASARR
jgi:hypothetical protein